MKTKRHLKKWVKQTLVILLNSVILSLFFLVENAPIQILIFVIFSISFSKSLKTML